MRAHHIRGVAGDGVKRWRVIFEGKRSRLTMTLLAKDKEQAAREAQYAQFRRHGRFDLTFDRLQQAHERGELTAEELKRELERRKRDRARYDDDEFKVKSVEEVKD